MFRPSPLTTILFFLTSLMCFGSLLPWTAFAGTGTLTLRVTGFDNDMGTASIALIRSAENWEAEVPFKGFYAPISSGAAQVKIEELPYGTYAVKAFHDENNNKKLDKRMFGIPKERYGFSNNARSPFGPPSFEDASFILDSAEKTVAVEVSPYLGGPGKEGTDDSK